MSRLPSPRGELHRTAARTAAVPIPPPARPASSNAGASASATVRSTHYGQAEIARVESILAGLQHGAEMSQLSVYVATPTEIAASCGATVVACYFPAEMEMVVSGRERSVAGVPPPFAIAHEYGHHIANTQSSDLPSQRSGGTMRWATYERVCQFIRTRQLHPSGAAAHYWRDPEEAFAQAYAHLNQPQARVSWQFSPLLRPSTAALAKIQADVSRPWSGPVTRTFAGSVAVSRAGPGGRGAAGGRGAVGAATALDGPPSLFRSTVRTPLDGRVEVTVAAPAGTDLAVSLRDPDGDRVLSRARTGEDGSASLGLESCGYPSLRLEVRSLGSASRFVARVTRP